MQKNIAQIMLEQMNRKWHVVILVFPFLYWRSSSSIQCYLSGVGVQFNGEVTLKILLSGAVEHGYWVFDGLEQFSTVALAVSFGSVESYSNLWDRYHCA